MYILHLPSWFPDEENPYSGNFIQKHISSIAGFYNSVTLKIITVSRSGTPRTVEKRNGEIIITYRVKRYRNRTGRIFTKFYRRYLYGKAIKEIVREYGVPDLIHLHVALPMGILAAKWSKFLNIPLLLTEHWSIYQPGNWQKLTPLLSRKMKSVYSQISAFTAVSENLRKHISARFPSHYSEVIPNVVDVDKFVPGKSDANKKVIIHISTLDNDAKNFNGIIRVIKRLSEQRDDFILKVIHENRNREAEKFVRDHGLSETVFFLGSKEEAQVAEELRKSDFLLLFSNYENLPCVIIEAFACGKPVVATRVGGIPEIVDPSRGILVEAGNEDELLMQVSNMLDNVTDYNPCEIRQYASSHFSGEIVGKRFLELYRKIIGTRD